MKKNLTNHGVSLVEVMLAVALFIITVVPIYYGLSYGAAEEINLEKRNIARKILESFQDEIKDFDYDDLQKFIKATNAEKSISEKDLPPNSFDELVQAQTKYKDFKFSGKVKASEANFIKSIEFKVEVTWTKGTGKTAIEKLAFIKVKR